MFETLEGKEIKRIEIDVIRLEELFERYALDSTGINFADYTKFDNGLFGSPSNNISNALNFSVSNTFETG